MPRTYLDRPVPIAAPATAPGRAALGVIRASGPGSIELAARCFSRPDALLAAPGYSLLHGCLVDPFASDSRTGAATGIDEVLVSVFRAPRSFTGEDGVEFSCHGSPAVLRRALAALESAGFAPALPGEFSFRAFANGKADLVQAEAVNELASAISESARDEALKRLSGLLSTRLAALRSAIVGLLAEIEARLDYPDEEGPDADSGSDPGGSAGPGAWLSSIGAIEGDVRALSSGFARGRIRQEGALAVVAGRPNAGKSSLFNLLLREERAIVSPEPGTTRDWLEAWIELDGLAVRLVDTAGLREALSDVESAGVSRSRDLARRADAVLYIADGNAGLADADTEFLRAHPGAIRVWNKSDLPDCAPAPAGWLPLSARTGEGLHSLEGAIRDLLESHDASGERGVLVASQRQKVLLDACADSLADALRDLSSGSALDAAAVHVRQAADRLGELSGEIAGEEVFERIFGSFCLGK